MKITKIKLNSYLRFKDDLQIDLTYPTGHEKAGRPLEKVCLLGQSATGKTTLLNLIRCCVTESAKQNEVGIDRASLVQNGVEMCYRLDGKSYSKMSAGEGENLRFDDYDHADPANPKKIEYVKPFKETLDHMLQDSLPRMINFPFCVVAPESLRREALGSLDLNATTGQLEVSPTTQRKYWDFDPTTIDEVWNIVFRRVESYVKEHSSRQAQSFAEIRKNPDIAAKVITEFKEWESSHPNPIHELAQRCLNGILNHYMLEVDTDLAKYQAQLATAEKMYLVIKRSSSDREVSYQFLSTGTKQVMLTAIPLFYLKPHNCIILMDQPETSLYPNIQQLLPRLYLDCAGESNQFFFATHSPIVASSFDPWEVVELKFDEKGAVYRKEYYSGDRHIDNYHINPRLLRWDSNYRILFDVSEEGNEERGVKMLELASLEKEIENTSDVEQKKDLFKKYKSLAEELDWPGK